MPEKTRVLIVDDEPEITQILQQCLNSQGYEVMVAANGLEGLRLFFNHRPDLVVLDIIMPKMDGMELCRRIRDVSSVPVLFLSARGAEIDIVKGLGLGGDDYIAKPVSLREFVARVQAVLRRSRIAQPEAPSTEYRDRALTVDLARHEVRVRGQKVALTPLEYKLLLYLVQNAPRALTLEQILDVVWGPEYESPENVKGYISQLRRKIEVDPENPALIITVRGVGYRYETSA